MTGTVSPDTNISVNQKSAYPITYTFTNTSTSGLPTGQVAISLPVGVTATDDKCSGPGFNAGESCDVVLTPTGIKAVTSLPVTFKYTGNGEDVSKSILLTPIADKGIVIGSYNGGNMYVSGAGDYDADTGVRESLAHFTGPAMPSTLDIESFPGGGYYVLNESGNDITSCGDGTSTSTTCEKIPYTPVADGGYAPYDPSSMTVSADPSHIWLGDFGKDANAHLEYCTGFLAHDATVQFKCSDLGNSTTLKPALVYRPWAINQFADKLYWGNSANALIPGTPNVNPDGEVYNCTIGSDDGVTINLKSCTKMVGYPNESANTITTVHYSGALGSVAYVSHGSKISIYKLKADLSYDTAHAIQVDVAALGLDGYTYKIAISPSHTFATVLHADKLSVCKIDKATGNFASCTAQATPSPIFSGLRGGVAYLQ